MKPAARLHIIKQREYRAACPKSPMGRAQPGQPGGPGGAGDGLNPSLYAPPDYGEESSYTYGVGIGQPVDGEGGMDGTDYEEYRATDSTNPYGGGGYGGGQFQGGNDYDYDAGGTDYGQPDYRGGGGACAVSSLRDLLLINLEKPSPYCFRLLRGRVGLNVLPAVAADRAASGGSTRIRAWPKSMAAAKNCFTKSHAETYPNVSPSLTWDPSTRFLPTKTRWDSRDILPLGLNAVWSLVRSIWRYNVATFSSSSRFFQRAWRPATVTSMERKAPTRNLLIRKVLKERLKWERQPEVFLDSAGNVIRWQEAESIRDPTETRTSTVERRSTESPTCHVIHPTEGNHKATVLTMTARSPSGEIGPIVRRFVTAVSGPENGCTSTQTEARHARRNSTIANLVAEADRTAWNRWPPWVSITSSPTTAKEIRNAPFQNGAIGARAAILADLAKNWERVSISFRSWRTDHATSSCFTKNRVTDKMHFALQVLLEITVSLF